MKRAAIAAVILGSAILSIRCGTQPAEPDVPLSTPPTTNVDNDGGGTTTPDAAALPLDDASVTRVDAGLQPTDAGIAARTSSIGRTVKAEALIDTDSFNPSDAELHEFARAANNLLVDRADVEIQLVGIRRVSYAAVKATLNPDAGRGGVSMTKVLQKIYETSTSPELLFFMYADDKSTSFGGYMIAFEKPGSCNRFKHPGTGKRTIIYGGAIDWKHMYNACGYDRTDPRNPVHVRSVSGGGECQGRNGVACELNSDFSYYQCSPIDHANPYNANRFSFVAATGVHELLHNFGSNGNLDHFGTAKCDEMMGGQSYKDAGAYVFQRNAGMCPNIFERFKQSYEECP